MSPKQASDILRHPQDYDDPELVDYAAKLMGSRGGKAGTGSAKKREACRQNALTRWAKVKAAKAAQEQK